MSIPDTYRKVSAVSPIYYKKANYRKIERINEYENQKTSKEGGFCRHLTLFLQIMGFRVTPSRHQGDTADTPKEVMA